MRITLPFGNATMTADLAGFRCLGTLDIADAPESVDEAALVRQALDAPIGQPLPLRLRARSGDRVTIVVSDSFRKTRVDAVLPALLDDLAVGGVPDEAVTFLFATGTHRPPTPAEQEAILGDEVYARFAPRCVCHDPDDGSQLVGLGNTSRGTPVRLHRLAVETDQLIVTGAVVLHYFGGFGGGRKALLPGVAARDTIAHNHAMNLDPREDRVNPAVRIGVLEGNPVAEDMLEGALKVRTEMLVNTVLDRRGQIAGVFAGDLAQAHRAACAFAADRYTAPIAERAGLVIAAVGATKNYVQTHKALYNAYQAVKPGGRIILLAPCEEGLGGEQFAQWMRLGSRAAIIAALRRQSEINGQTALSTIEKTPITTLVSELSAEDAALLGVRTASNLQAAVDALRPELPADPSCWVMPSAAYTVPVFQQTGT